MKTITLKLYDYIELDDEIKTKVAEECYYNDGGDYIYFETDNLLSYYIDTFSRELELDFSKDDFDFYDDGYDTNVNLRAGELEYSIFKNNTTLDKYVDNHITSKRLAILLKHFDVQYYWTGERIEVDCISSDDDSKYYERCEKHLAEELPKVLQPVTDKINEILKDFNQDFNQDLYNLQHDIRGYLGDDTINDGLVVIANDRLDSLRNEPFDIDTAEEWAEILNLEFDSEGNEISDEEN